MYTPKERAELADICYMTIERESAKPLKDMDTALVDACLELAGLLLDINALTQDELDTAKQKIKAMTVHRRKSIRIRIIAAVAAVLLLLGTTVYAFSDWIVEVFGMETLMTIEPGDKVTVEQHELEKPSGVIKYNSIEELLNDIERSVYLPSKLPDEFELSEAKFCNYENEQLDITWINGQYTLTCMITFEPSYFNESQFNSHDYEYYSKDGHPFDFVQVGTYWQAMGWIDNNEYIIFADNTELLKEFIDSIAIMN